MDNLEEKVLDYAYLTIEDFLNSKHIRVDNVEHNASSENLDFHFNKPGFDLAIIVTDEALLPKISDFQATFHNTCRLTTHVILLPNISRLKYCIIELKMMEILYAVIVNKNSHTGDDYDVFILYEIIEYQKGMRFTEALDFFNNDYQNYLTQLQKMVLNPKRYPHAKNRQTDGFIEPSRETRHLLCLLFDGRMLEMKELQELRNFVKSRKEAIEKLGNRPINYGINERPIPSYRQDPLRYYIYEPAPKTANNIDGRSSKLALLSNLRKDECRAGSADAACVAIAGQPLDTNTSKLNSDQSHSLANNSFSDLAPPNLYNQAKINDPHGNVAHLASQMNDNGTHNTPSQSSERKPISKCQPNQSASQVPPYKSVSQVPRDISQSQMNNISTQLQPYNMASSSSRPNCVPLLSIQLNKSPQSHHTNFIPPQTHTTRAILDSQLYDIPLPSRQYNTNPTPQPHNVQSQSLQVNLSSPPQVSRSVNAHHMQNISPSPQPQYTSLVSQQYNTAHPPLSNHISPLSQITNVLSPSQTHYNPPSSQLFNITRLPQASNVSPQPRLNISATASQPQYTHPASQQDSATLSTQSNNISHQSQMNQVVSPSQPQYISPMSLHYSVSLPPPTITTTPPSQPTKVLPPQTITPTTPPPQATKVLSSPQALASPTSLVQPPSQPSKPDTILAKLQAMKMAHEAKTAAIPVKVADTKGTKTSSEPPTPSPSVTPLSVPRNRKLKLPYKSVNVKSPTCPAKEELKHSPGSKEDGKSDMSASVIKEKGGDTAPLDNSAPRVDPLPSMAEAVSLLITASSVLCEDISSDSSEASDTEKDDQRNITYHLSPISDDSKETLPHQGDECRSAGGAVSSSCPEIKIEIDLTDDWASEVQQRCSPPAKRFKKAIPPRPGQPAFYLVDLAEEMPTVQPKPSKVSCSMLLSLLKFVINLSSLQLSPHNGVLHMLHNCLADIKRRSTHIGVVSTAVDLRSCRMSGCREIIRIIESLCETSISVRDNVEDLCFMWSYFPKNVTEDSVTIVFYKLMKVLELTKLTSTPNDLLMNLLQRLQKVVNYNFHLTETAHLSCNDLNHFPSMFNEYFSLREELHNLNMALPPPGPPCVALNPDINKDIAGHRITFVVGPLMDFFIGAINSIHYQLDTQAMEVIYGAMRTLRFCMRKICVKVLPEHLQQQIQFIAPGNLMDRTLELLDEINYVIREVNLLNCVLFTKKHYDFVNLILDFTIKIEQSVAGDSESEPDLFDKEYLIHLDPAQFMLNFSSSVKTAVWPYHQDTEIEVFKKAIKNRWIDTLHQAFKGIPPEPDGSRISKELAYLLPRCWGKHTFDEAVIEASTLSYSDWEKMLDQDVAASRKLFAEVRNNYLIWLSNNGLEHRKAMQLMTANQKLLDAKILQEPL